MLRSNENWSFVVPRTTCLHLKPRTRRKKAKDTRGKLRLHYCLPSKTLNMDGSKLFAHFSIELLHPHFA